MALLGKVAYRKEIGLAIGDHELAACLMTTTPIGRMVANRARIEYEPDGLGAAIQELLGRLLSRDDLARARVYVGLPSLRTFFSTRPIQAENLQAAPEVLLHEVLQTPSLNIDDMVVDMIKIKPGQRLLASIVSCRKKYLATVLTALDACGIKPSRAEPAACSLVRDAARRHRAPRKSRAFVRVFLGTDQGLAVLVAGTETPLMWRPFGLPGGGEAAAILAAVGSLATLGGYCGLEDDIDAVLVHGRPDLGPLAEVGGCQTLKGARVLRHDDPSLDNAAVAQALVEVPGEPDESFNLVRTTGATSSFLDIFPWAQVPIQVVILIVATFFLRAYLADARDRAAVVALEDARFAWAAQLTSEKLQAERKDLAAQVDAIRKFLESRMLWTTLVRDISDRVADDLALTLFQGDYELEGKARTKRQLKLTLSSPIPRTGAMPREVDAFLRTLREDPLLKQSFPNVELGELRRNQTAVGDPTAVFTVICLPTGKALDPPKPPAAAKKKAK
jgi:hypothetical protein